MELAALIGEPKWVHIDGTELRLLMRPYPMGLLLGRRDYDADKLRRMLHANIEAWNVVQQGEPVPLDPDILPLPLLPAILTAWQQAFTQVTPPLSPKRKSTPTAAARKRRRRS